jgi:hypothetical protein
MTPTEFGKHHDCGANCTCRPCVNAGILPPAVYRRHAAQREGHCARGLENGFHLYAMLLHG